MPGENAPVDETGLINPDAFPCKPETLDPETIDSAGKSLRSMGVDIVSPWASISFHGRLRSGSHGPGYLPSTSLRNRSRCTA